MTLFVPLIPFDYNCTTRLNMINYPELLVPAIIAFLVVLWVLPWHFRLRNIATLSMCFWMTALNLSHIVNGV